MVCIGIGTAGCFYPWKQRVVEANQPPEEMNVTPPPGTSTSTVISGQQTFYVLVSDPEQDDVTFDWTLTRDGKVQTATYIVDQTHNTVGSQLTLIEDLNLDGQTLSCRYWDSGNGERQTLEWTLRVASVGDP